MKHFSAASIPRICDLSQFSSQLRPSHREEKLRGNDGRLGIYRIVRNPDEQAYRICAVPNDKRCVRDFWLKGAMFVSDRDEIAKVLHVYCNLL